MEGLVRPRRSVLYMPGSNGRALEKAKTLPADGLIFDLEDAVAPDAKAVARQQVCEAVRTGEYGRRARIVRVVEARRVVALAEAIAEAEDLYPQQTV